MRSFQADWDEIGGFKVHRHTIDRFELPRHLTISDVPLGSDIKIQYGLLRRKKCTTSPLSQVTRSRGLYQRDCPLYHFCTLLDGSAAIMM